MESIFKKFIKKGSDFFFKKCEDCEYCRLDQMSCECLRVSHHQLMKFSSTVETLNEQLIHQKIDFEKRMKSLEDNCNKILDEINNLRKAINDSLDELEKNTKKELDTLLATMRTSIQTNIDNCNESINTMTCVQKDWLSMMHEVIDPRIDPSFSEKTYKKCLHYSTDTENVLQEMKVKNEVTFTFNPSTLILETLSTLSGLGQILQNEKQSQGVRGTTQDRFTRQTFEDTKQVRRMVVSLKPRSSMRDKLAKRLADRIIESNANKIIIQNANKIIKLEKSKIFMVRMKSESHICLITGICETVAGLLIIDSRKSNIKLLDENYNVVAFCNLPGITESMCSIDSSLVAVAMASREIHFIRVTNGQLVHDDRTIKPQHFCVCIAHQKGNLYIASGTALYKYTIDGRLVCKMYEDTSCFSTVKSCAVSQDGSRIYVANQDCSKRLTLSSDGKVISKLSHPALKLPSTFGHHPLHVTGLGQVLVCNADFNTVIQVDRDGKNILAEVVTRNDDFRSPLCVFYRNKTGTLVVELMYNNHIMVFTHSEC
ncbi:uncharacterized protein LOC127832341 [Dreissena polymorpha]|uniref:uncharacterized protein LOC127832341 n=1 Tax=Dreissena polymorpha TaxID=45954 RepID=UPI002264AEED|nr:uncharacterized protein LOC127832341 [Dreissena polymorpha]